MRTTRHLYSTGSATLFACLTALATGCSGDGASNPNDPTPTGGPGPSTTGTDATVTGTGGAASGTTQGTSTTAPSTTGASTDGGIGGSGGAPLPPDICVPGVQASSQIARIKNAHYD